jgi:general secretion pathway protein G
MYLMENTVTDRKHSWTTNNRVSGSGFRVPGVGYRTLYPYSSGFTLIELLLVMVILAILAAIVVPKFTGRTEQARVTAAKADIASMRVALGAFETDTGRFPTTDEGLNALITAPPDIQGWTRPYLDKVPQDPWGHAYIYRCPGSNNKDFDLFSAGPDGREGSADDVEP